MKVVVVSGLSGAGKTVALGQFEDVGFHCIDNLPLELLKALSVEFLEKPRYRQLAIGVDARESPEEIARFAGHVEALKQRGVDVQVMFLNASDDVLIRRYGETRRKHPLTGTDRTLAEAIDRERALLRPIADLAEITLDTSDLNLHELREAVRARQPQSGAGRLALVLMSFGYKNGIPEGADYVFDMRCLPNPHWVAGLRAKDGRDPDVVEFLDGHPGVRMMADEVREFLERFLPEFEAQDRAYVTVAIGCTGGRHRSVYVVERLAGAFRDRFDPVIVKHKEIS